MTDLELYGMCPVCLEVRSVVTILIEGLPVECLVCSCNRDEYIDS